jgi:hypothetical protein
LESDRREAHVVNRYGGVISELRGKPNVLC